MPTFLTRDRSVCLQPVSQLAARSLDWLWPGRLALGKLAMLDGDPLILITCRDEKQPVELLEWLGGEGLECRALLS
jgi:hypothetical protein